MNMVNHTRLDLVEGGNIFKQGEHAKLKFAGRDSKGRTVDLTGKDIAVAIWNSKGVMYEGAAGFDSENQLIELNINQLLQHGDFQIEFTATDSADPNYRQKFPSGEYEGKIYIKPSADNIDFVGVSVTTVKQLRDEISTAAAAFTQDSEVALARLGERSLPEFNRKLIVQLDETGAEAKRKKEPEDLSGRTLELVTGGGTVSILSDPQIGSVSHDKTTFLTVGKNRFNKDTVLDGYYVSGFTGALLPATGFSTSDYIPCKPNQTFSRKQSNYIAYAGMEKNHLSGTSSSGLTFTTPVDCYYFRVSMSTSVVGTEQVELGSISTPWESYKNFHRKLKLEQENLSDELLFKGTNVDGVSLYQTENLFNKEIVTQGYYDATGTFVNDTGYRVHPPIPVKEGYTYRALTAGHRALRNEAGQWVGNLGGSGNLKIPTGLGVKTIQPISTVPNLDLEMFVEGSVYPSNYIPNKKYQLSPSKYDARFASSRIRDKKWAAIGDSNTFASYSYVSQIADSYGVVATNFGMNGRSAARRGGQTDIDIPPVVDVVSTVPTTNEIITVVIGVNDYHSQVPLGAENSSDATTFNGALNSIAIQLIERFPGKKIAFMTPYQRRDSVVVRPITLPMYVEAMKKAAYRHGIPCFDLFANCGLYPNSNLINTTYYADADGSGLHPNAAGHRVAVPRIAAFLETL